MNQPTDNKKSGQVLDELIEQSGNVVRLDSGRGNILAECIRRTNLRVDPKQQSLQEHEVATDLVRRIRAGDPSAEAELIERYQQRVRYVLLRQMPQHRHDVDDVLHDTLIAAIVRLRERGIEDSSRLGGFIYGIAKNLRRANLRDHAKRDGEVDPELLTRLPDETNTDPEQLAAGRETTQIVRQLLDELGKSRGRKRDREVLIRLYVKQQERQEICQELGIAPDHLRRVVHRAKQRLKALMLERRDELNLVPGD